MLHYIYCLPLCAVLIFAFIALTVWGDLSVRCSGSIWGTGNCVLLIASVAVVIYTTLLSRTSGSHEVILTPFVALTAARQQPELYREMLMNVFLFFPLGLTLSNALPQKWYRWVRIILTTLIGCILSTGIEYAQYRYALGMVEIDDVICNTLGTFVGALSLVVSYFFGRVVHLTMDAEREVKSSMASLETKAERMYGIDFLKIVSMLMVVLLHVLNHGGILEELNGLSAQYAAGHLLRCLAICAVDVYVMISGYLYVKKEFRLRNIIRLWLTVLFYSAMIPLLLKITGEEIGIKTAISGFFPILRSQYWFFTQYFALFFMMPVLNRLIQNRRLAGKTILVLVLLCSVLPVFSLGNDLFKTGYGYSFLWFAVLYLCGGYVREYRVSDEMSAKVAAIGYVCCTLCMWLLEIGTYAATNHIFGDARYTEIFACYTFPLVIGSAFFLLVLFSKFKFKSKIAASVIPTVSALTFGVYLIHDNSSVRENFILGRFAQYADLPCAALVLRTLLLVLAIFTICALIEYCRTVLFRCLNVNKCSEKIEKMIGKTAQKFTSTWERKE